METAVSNDEAVLWVKGSTSAPDLASTIAHKVYEGHKVILRAIGAAAVNQTCKAVAIASGMAAPRGFVLSMRPGFTDVDMPDGTVTAMVFRILTNE